MCWPVKASAFMFEVYWDRIRERGVCRIVEEGKNSKPESEIVSRVVLYRPVAR